jgi:hypothetical protein
MELIRSSPQETNVHVVVVVVVVVIIIIIIIIVVVCRDVDIFGTKTIFRNNVL